MPVGAITVEPVESRPQLRRFREVPFVLHGTDPRWAAPHRPYEAWLLDARRHPYFDRGDAAYFLARVAGQPIGRIAAHHRGGVGAFGCFDVPEEPAVAEALLTAARTWLTEEGLTCMEGPQTWSADDDPGVLVAGFDVPAATGLAWHPEHPSAALRAAGGVEVARTETHRLALPPTTPIDPPPAAADAAPPPHAGRYADPALVLADIAAVPDVSRALADTTLASAWRRARELRDRPSDVAVCVRLAGEPALLVPGLAAAAHARGYTTLLAPWSPTQAEPERVHARFRISW